jgi:hypothetical protein
LTTGSDVALCVLQLAIEAVEQVDTSESLTQEHCDAIQRVEATRPDVFRAPVLVQLQMWPYVNRYFRSSVEKRLRQGAIHKSPIIRKLLTPMGLCQLEDRLARVAHRVSGFERIIEDASYDSESGDKTDEFITDSWAEILAADFLLHKFQFTCVEKVVRGKKRPKVDFMALNGQCRYAVEVTRLRPRLFRGATSPGIIPDCYEQENVNAIKKSMQDKLTMKNSQFGRFRASGIQLYGWRFDRTMLFIKFSQDEYQDCKALIADVGREILTKEAYPEIDELVLVYDIEQFDRLYNGS